MYKNNFFKPFIMFSLCITFVFFTGIKVFAADSTTIEGESYGNLSNNTFQTADYFGTSGLTDTSSAYLTGALGNSKDLPNPNDDRDYYKISVSSALANKGRFAIKLENIPTGCNYDLYLYDANQVQIGQSLRSGNLNEIVRTPEISSGTTYYMLVVPAPGTSVNATAKYSVKLENTVKTITSTLNSTPSTLNSKGTAKSNSGLVDLRKSVPADALVRKITVSATKSSSALSYNYIMYVSSGTHTTWETGVLNGEVTAFNIADPTKRIHAKDAWYMAFSATPINPSKLNVTTITGVKLIITYEYDNSINY
ncbi:hypothetical protein KTC96_24025 (plasmid) [Clostridium estertheticum]|uniref:hypothetical protein n=1 Tax=Clostridium estertheticum TaxID=238834 RepID=UPI001C7D19BD|nr:hypothetical protein [Clostridium estertheticum]MBX4262161.1 hypothetical protein [Clostridium estertheticum]WLC73195.1 hypothetical protein KTC96_24025 [Clostridium estertheticum]